MPRHIIATVFAVASLAACAGPSASRKFDDSELTRPHADAGLTHEEQEWLALGRPEDALSVDNLGLGAPTAASLTTDSVDDRTAPGAVEKISNMTQQPISNCQQQGLFCDTDDDDFIDWFLQ